MDKQFNANLCVLDANVLAAEEVYEEKRVACYVCRSSIRGFLRYSTEPANNVVSCVYDWPGKYFILNNECKFTYDAICSFTFRIELAKPF